MQMDYKAMEARMRIEEARSLLESAMGALASEGPDWARCQVLMDMASDVLPVVADSLGDGVPE